MTSTLVEYVPGPVGVTVCDCDGNSHERIVGFPAMGECGKVLDYPSAWPISKISPCFRQYLMPRSIRFMVPRPCDRACSPPIAYSTVYEETLKAGLRFPLHPAFRGLLQRVGIPLGQIQPNSFRHLIGLGVQAHENDIPLTVELCLKYFHFNFFKGMFYLSPRLKFKADAPGKVFNWQSKYCFVRFEDVPTPEWRLEWKDEFRVGDEEADPENKLMALGIVPWSYPEVKLAEAGLSPYQPGTDVDPCKDPFILTA